MPSKITKIKFSNNIKPKSSSYEPNLFNYQLYSLCEKNLKL